MSVFGRSHAILSEEFLDLVVESVVRDHVIDVKVASLTSSRSNSLREGIVHVLVVIAIRRKVCHI